MPVTLPLKQANVSGANRCPIGWFHQGSHQSSVAPSLPPGAFS